jgi:hypothetical protein
MLFSLFVWLMLLVREKYWWQMNKAIVVIEIYSILDE